MDNISHSLMNAKIMLVDDELTTMYVVQTYLEESGYNNFILVEDSTRAIETLHDCLPDILLLDLMMPEVSGFDILKNLRNDERFKYLPIIVLTSSSDAENMLKALELGASDFLAKPVNPSELGLRVRNTLAAKAYMDQLAFYDPLTRLPNKYMFSDRFEWSLNKAKRYNDRLALFSISIDNFSRLNASIGLAEADGVLAEVGERLKAVVRDADTITRSNGESGAHLSLFRMEGSVFSILLDRTKTAESSASVAQRILDVLKKPMIVGSDEIYVTASIGIATYPDEADTCVALRQLATSAKDFSARQGGDIFHFSSKAINNLYKNRLNLELNLRKAIDKNEFLFHFQPKVNVQTGVIQGVEALLRWQPEGGGLVSPGEFIPLLEDTGLIVPVGKKALADAFARMEAWMRTGKPPINMAINISVKQMDRPDFYEVIQKLIRETTVPPQHITLEITESLLLKDIEAKIKLLSEFRKLGLKISIDDFGTGYSSLGYLARLPLDELKIDRTFIIDVVENKDSQAIVSTILFLAKSLGLSTVAEGVETLQQLEFLQQAGCDQYQGYYFSRPVPEYELLDLLK